jgi:thymidylate synthase (FAD)
LIIRLAEVHIEEDYDGEKILRQIEKYARNCYKSEAKTTDMDGTKAFVKKLLHTLKHEGIADHHMITVRVVCDRGISHEIVRHRIAAYLQESTRYCDYTKAGQIQVIDIKQFMTSAQFDVWTYAMNEAEKAYNELRRLGARPEIARSVLPNSLKTEIIMSLNLTSWRNFFKKRACNAGAHVQMKEIAVPLLKEFQRVIPVIFDDLIPIIMPERPKETS